MLWAWLVAMVGIFLNLLGRVVDGFIQTRVIHREKGVGERCRGVTSCVALVEMPWCIVMDLTIHARGWVVEAFNKSKLNVVLESFGVNSA